MLPLLDTHQHLIYPDALEYGWTAELPALAGRAFTLEDYRALTAGAGVAGTIFMEAAVDHDDHHAETEMVAELARRPGSGILGIISSIRPENAPGFDAWVEEGRDLGVVGYRRILHVVPDDVSRSETFRANIRKLGQRGLPFDLCFLARQLPIALELRGPAPTRSSSSTTAATPTSPPAPSSPGAPASGRSPPCRTWSRSSPASTPTSRPAPPASRRCVPMSRR